MAKPKKPPRPGKRCIFCDSPGPMSKEDIWPTWLRKYLSPIANESDVIHEPTVYDLKGNIIHHQRTVRRIGTHMSTRKFPIVCGACNNGWMSKIQEETKPLLLAFLSDWPALSKKDQMQLACWATMFTMVVDFHIPGNQAVSQEDRNTFRKTRQPLDSWSVWAARFTGTERHTSFFHSPLGPIHDLKNSHTNPPRFDTQTTTLAFGHLLLQTFSTDNSFIKKLLPINFSDRLEVRRIWPITHEVIARPTRFFADRGFESFATGIAHYLVTRISNPFD